MKSTYVIKRFFRSDSFCTPSDFYWCDRKKLKKNMPNVAKRSLLLTLYYIYATFLCVIYYLILPYRIIGEFCEAWCKG